MTDTPTAAPTSSLTLQLAEQYEVNSQRPFFPVNSLRLFYFMISDHLTQNNTDVLEKVGSLIPKVEAVLADRTQHRSTNPEATAETDHAESRDTVGEVYKVIDTPFVRYTFDHLFTYLYPLQDDLFINFYQAMSNDHAITAQHLMLLLKTRAMDSILFSTLIGQLTNGVNHIIETEGVASFEQLQTSLDWHINLAYQINDLIDAVVFAREDIQADAFSLFQVIRKSAPEAEAAKELIKNTLADLQSKTTLFPFPGELQTKVNQFYKELIDVVTS
jgi:hypothetical protein